MSRAASKPVVVSAVLLGLALAIPTPGGAREPVVVGVFEQQVAARFDGVVARRVAVGSDGVPLAETASGVLAFEDGAWQPSRRALPAQPALSRADRAALELVAGGALEVRDVAAGPGGGLAVAAASGLFTRHDGRWARELPHGGARSWAPRDVRAVGFDAEGRLWFASAQGVGRDDGAVAGWKLFTGEDGLPVADVTCMAFAPRGVVWLGTRLGAVRFDGERWEYRQGRRWLPNDEVRDVAVAPDGTAWFATTGGVGCIALHRITLADKARFFEEEIDARHRRTPFGFVLGVAVERAGDASSWTQHDSDNDGLWTSMYGAGACFEYAATRNSDAKRRATLAFKALEFLGDVTQGGRNPAPPGFVARTVLPTSGPDPNTGRLERDREFQRTRDRLWKVIDPRWPVSADGRWYWKCDTSSDELDGHYFFYARYHDLVAETEDEKRAVRAVVARLTDHLIEHDYSLVDHDGQPTRWGRFGPQDLNHDPDWYVERGLNSLSVLSYLAVAAHLTGDAKYARAAQSLIDDHAYALNVMEPKRHTGPGTGNQSDDEMAFMSFYNLLLYERDDARKRLWSRAFHDYWLLERPERNPLFNFLYAAVCDGVVWRDAFGEKDLSPGAGWLEESIDTLVRFPLDRFDWGHRNSHRLDVDFMGDSTRSRLRGRRRDGMVLPIDERFVEHWNHDPWTLDTGGGGRRLADGAAYTLPYWLGVYHGFLR